MEKIELKPCPFCGSPVWFSHNMELEPDGIHCQQCGFVVRWLQVRAKPGEKFEVVMRKIAEKWNMRAAQPAIIRCRDCEWWTKQEASLQGRCALSGTYPTGAWYCANARRRGEADG